MRQIDVLHRGLREGHRLLRARRDPRRSRPPVLRGHAAREALGGERPKALLLTHIHFDHAGAAGALVRRWPDLEVYVHERGAPHMARPERLVASAARLYGGEEGLRETWGEVVPVPEENLKILSGGETVLGFKVAYTPGHASHHVCFFHEATGVAFVGDMAGVRIPPSGLTLAPTPAARHRRRGVGALAVGDRRLGARRPGADALRHGRRPVRPARRRQGVAALAGRPRRRRRTRRASWPRCTSGSSRTSRSRTSPRSRQAAPLDHLFLGLDRWHSKRG